MTGILASRSMKSFLCNDEGLVTTEWVAIAAAVVVMGVGVASVIEPSVNTTAVAIGSNLLAAVNASS